MWPRCFLERSSVFTHETVRDREARFAPLLAAQLRAKRRSAAGAKWHADETYVRVGGRRCYGIVNLEAGCLECDTGRMNTVTPPNYAGSRFPTEVIAYAVWRYSRFALSYRDVAELLAGRGVIVTDETIRKWCLRFGQTDANTLRRRRPRAGDKWYLDAAFMRINGATQYLWRAVDRDGTVLDILVQSRRDTAAAKKFFRRLLKGRQYVPRVVITDTLASYGAARREVLPGAEHRRHKRRNNRAETSHQPTRERERRMRRCKSPGHAQRFLAAPGPIMNHFRPRRHLLDAAAYRDARDQRFTAWRAIVGLPAAVCATTPARISTPARRLRHPMSPQVDSAPARPPGARRTPGVGLRRANGMWVRPQESDPHEHRVGVWTRARIGLVTGARCAVSRGECLRYRSARRDGDIQRRRAGERAHVKRTRQDDIGGRGG